MKDDALEEMQRGPISAHSYNLQPALFQENPAWLMPMSLFRLS